MAKIDVPHFVAQNGLTLLDTTDEGRWMRFLVLKDAA
jgi:TusA-related sulfurtransferase